MALPTRGRILLDTTVGQFSYDRSNMALILISGDIEIELWSKEAPKACRNLIQLALEGKFIVVRNP